MVGKRGNPNWVKGVSPNPGGRPKGLPELEALARSHAPAAIEALVKALGDERLCVAAATALLDRGFGRPSQRVKAQINPMENMNAHELRCLVASLAAIAGDTADAGEGSTTTH